jgi:hypothetical protein
MQSRAPPYKAPPSTSRPSRLRCAERRATNTEVTLPTARSPGGPSRYAPGDGGRRRTACVNRGRHVGVLYSKEKHEHGANRPDALCCGAVEHTGFPGRRN